MDNIDLSESIEALCENIIFALYHKDKLRLEGSFTLTELKNIVELLEQECN